MPSLVAVPEASNAAVLSKILSTACLAPDPEQPLTTMSSFLLGKLAGAPEPAGSREQGELAGSATRLGIGLGFAALNGGGLSTHTVHHAGKVARKAGGMVIGEALRTAEAATNLKLQNAILIASPRYLPAVDLPFWVRRTAAILIRHPVAH